MTHILKSRLRFIPFAVVGVALIVGCNTRQHENASLFNSPVRFASFEAGTNYTMIVNGANGGSIRDHITTAIKLMGSATRVVVDGPCPSSCVVTMEMVRSKMCFTDNASFGFHQSVMFDEHSQPTFLDMHPYFRPEIGEWVKDQGGWPTPEYQGTQLVNANLLWMQPEVMRKFWTHCEDAR